MGSNGKWSHLSCVTAPNGDVTFSGNGLFGNDETVSVSGAAHKRNSKVNGIPVELPPRVEGQWTVSDHQGVIVSGNTDGTVKSRDGFDPELALDNTETMTRRAAKVCQSRQNKLNFRPAKMDFNLF
jgi:hypothetical protein